MTDRIEKGLVTTIIPVFNRAEMIVTAVESVLAQTYRPIEIIVVDDGSDLVTQETVLKLAMQHPEVSCLKQDNAGPGAAREYGRQIAKGEYIQYLDSDDVLLKEKFALQVEALSENLDCDVAYGKTDHKAIGSSSAHKAWKQTGGVIENMFPLFLKARWWGTSTPLYRRAVTDKAGPWLPLINEEDWEYDCRIAALGGRLAYVDDFVSVQYRHTKHLSDSGSTDFIKLTDRCTAREHMFESATRSVVEIPKESMQFFAKAAFLLARECAAQNLGECVSRMLLLATKARGKKDFKQTIFTLIGKIFGWPVAAKTAIFIQK